MRSGITIHSGVRSWPDVIVEEGAVVKENLLNDRYDTKADGS
jgi:hypothetical protein